MWRIARGLYLGDQLDSQNRYLLTHHGITHVLNCASELPCLFPTDFEYLHLELNDPDPAFSDCIDAICAFIRRGRRAGAVMVHCRMGLSRSPAAILAYVCSRGKTLRQALRLLQKRVGEEDGGFVEPHEVFLEQLRDYYDDPGDGDG